MTIKPTYFKLRQLTQSISLILMASTAAQSAEFIVTTTGDTGGDSIAEDSPGVFVVDTLRSAVELADNENSFPGADRIRFDDDLFINNQATINLDRIGDSSTFGSVTSNSALGINSEITIVGPQDATLILTAGELRHFQINDGGHLNINQVTLDEGFASGRGGAIYVRTGGSLNLSHSTLSNNKARDGGAVFIGRAVSGVTSNISHSHFSRNQASIAGGAVSQSSGISLLTISNSTFTHNSARSGGALFASSKLIIGSSTITNNTADLSSGSSGGGISINNVGSITLLNSTISNNQTSGDGGGIYVGTGPEGGINTIINSTISNNHSRSSSSPQLNNQPVNRGDYIDFDSSGGGVFAGYSTEALIIHNSIIVGNTETTAMLPDDVAASPLPESSHNFIGAGDSVLVITNGLNGNQIGTRDVPIDAQLQVLADNGGNTLTQLPSPNSPVVDTGNDAVCETTDQRGRIRPQDGDDDGSAGCDIGAVELGDVTDLIFSDGYEEPNLNEIIYNNGFEN